MSIFLHFHLVRSAERVVFPPNNESPTQYILMCRDGKTNFKKPHNLKYIIIL